MQYSEAQLLVSFLNYLAAVSYSSFAYLYISNLILLIQTYFKKVYCINILLKRSRNYLIGKWHVSDDCFALVQ